MFYIIVFKSKLLQQLENIIATENIAAKQSKNSLKYN